MGEPVCHRISPCPWVNVDGGSHCCCGHVLVEWNCSGLGNKQRHCDGGVGGASCGGARLDSRLRGSICLFDKKSSIRKENKQPGVLLLRRQRKSSYSSTTQYLQWRSDTHTHTLGGTCTFTCLGGIKTPRCVTDTQPLRGKQVLGWNRLSNNII